MLALSRTPLTPLFQSFTPDYLAGLKGRDRKGCSDLAGILANYNNGIISPGHCTE